jgi:hypothetical protein
VIQSDNEKFHISMSLTLNLLITAIWNKYVAPGEGDSLLRM